MRGRPGGRPGGRHGARRPDERASCSPRARPCLHFYTFNRSKATIEVLTALGMAPASAALMSTADGPGHARGRLRDRLAGPAARRRSPSGCPAGSACRRCCCTWASAWCSASTSFGLDLTNTLLTEQLGFVALVFILAEGGLTTRWENVRPALGLGISLATVSVVVSIAVAGLGVHLLLGLRLADLAAVGRRAVQHRRGRGVLGAARGRRQAAAVGRAGAGVRTERRARGDRRAAAGRHRPRSPGSTRCWWSTS